MSKMKKQLFLVSQMNKDLQRALGKQVPKLPEPLVTEYDDDD
jgi:hypothetical protein